MADKLQHKLRLIPILIIKLINYSLYLPIFKKNQDTLKYKKKLQEENI